LLLVVVYLVTSEGLALVDLPADLDFRRAEMTTARFRLAIWPVAVLLSAVTACSEEDAPTPPTVTITETASPTPSSSIASPTKPAQHRAHSQAKFKHFIVTVDDLQRRNASEVRLLAKVCVRSLPPDPQGNRTRISWDPWSVRARSKTIDADIDADKAHATFKGAFPPDHTYKVGQCASGWVPFFTRGSVTKIKYANGVGNVAVWDPKHLDRKPETRTVRPRTTTPKRSTP
jgi:hypothetical protein